MEEILELEYAISFAGISSRIWLSVTSFGCTTFMLVTAVFNV
jgi:hypothetical protein